MFFKKKWICSQKYLIQNYTPPHISFFISQINIMHKYTETESKYTGKIGDTYDVGTNVHNTVKLKIMPSEVRLKIFET